MLLPWLLLSIFPSICLSSFSNVKTRKKIGTTLKLGALSYDEDNEEVFLKACRDGHALVEAILTPPRNSTILNKSNQDGQTGLHLGSEKNKLKVVKFLIEQPEINLNVQDQKGSTALHLAIKKNSLEVSD